MRRLCRPVAAAALALVLAVLLATPAPAADRYTPLVADVPSTPRWFEDSDGRFHIVYELYLTNGFPVPVSLSSLRVRDADRRRPLERLRGAELTAMMSPMVSPTEPSTTVAPSGTSVVWLDVTVPSRRLIPRAVRHSFTVAVPPGLPVPTSIRETGGFARVDQRAPVALGPPLRGGGWMAIGSCCDGPHRRSIQPVNGGLHLGQRFAIDWNGMDAQRRAVVGNPFLNSSWTYFGAPVLAVRDARVVAAVDRFPDQVPLDPKPVTLRSADGNHVILALGGERYVFYAHLEAGSVGVQVGQRVRRGQVIGRLGNSGSSTGPHLHMHVMDRPSALASDGLPYVFDSFRVAGRTPPIDSALEQIINGGEPVPIDHAGAGQRRRELPVGRDVVAFPGR